MDPITQLHNGKGMGNNLNGNFDGGNLTSSTDPKGEKNLPKTHQKTPGKTKKPKRTHLYLFLKRPIPPTRTDPGEKKTHSKPNINP